MEAAFERITPNWLQRAFVYTGSVGTGFRVFRYRLAQDGEAKTVHAATYSNLCYDKAEDVEKRDFAWDDDGVAELRAWLQENYEAYLARQRA